MNDLPTGAADEPRHKPTVSFNPKTGLFGMIATARLALLQAGLGHEAAEMCRRAFEAFTLDDARRVVLEYVEEEADPRDLAGARVLSLFATDSEARELCMAYGASEPEHFAWLATAAEAHIRAWVEALKRDRLIAAGGEEVQP